MKHICICILLVCGIFSATGQKKFGISGGYILSTFIDDDGRTFEADEGHGKLYSQSSVYGGVYYDNSSHEKFSTRFELNYIVAGGMLEAHLKNPAVSFISRVEFHQLQIPVSANYKLSQRFAIYGGLSVNVQVATRYKFVTFSVPAFPSGLANRLPKELAKETRASLTGLSLGVFGGAAYKFSDRIGLTARYNYTFTNMSSQYDESLRMHFLQAGICYDLIK